MPQIWVRAVSNRSTSRVIWVVSSAIWVCSCRKRVRRWRAIQARVRGHRPVAGVLDRPCRAGQRPQPGLVAGPLLEVGVEAVAEPGALGQQLTAMVDQAAQRLQGPVAADGGQVGVAQG
jgi:hypothetical protein